MLSLFSLIVSSVGCATVRDQMDSLGSSAEAISDHARFCLAVIRTVQSVEADTHETAAEAAEEALATAPANTAADARAVVDALRNTIDGDGNGESVAEVADQLLTTTRRLCDPA